MVAVVDTACLTFKTLHLFFIFCAYNSLPADLRNAPLLACCRPKLKKLTCSVKLSTNLFMYPEYYENLAVYFSR